MGGAHRRSPRDMKVSDPGPGRGAATSPQQPHGTGPFGETITFDRRRVGADMGDPHLDQPPGWAGRGGGGLVMEIINF